MGRSLRVATVSHGHPTYAPGGAEIAAATLHAAMREIRGVETLHLAAAPPHHPGVGEPLGDGTSLFASRRLDAFTLLRQDPAATGELLQMLQRFSPDVIHLHHTLGIGADALFELRLRFPHAVILLTLHEFIAICHNQGQMMKTDGRLCSASDAAACSTCFPDISAARFLRREHALKAMLSLVDGFIAPSAFLAGRYMQWGLPDQKIVVLENAVRHSSATLRREDPRSEHRGRFAFFGQITPFKGLDVLLEAVIGISDAEWEGCSLDIFGSGLERQPMAFHSRMRALLQSAEHRVTLRGPYDGAELPALMAQIDWAVVPSIWWENSPLVIQEAFRNGLPVIASDIGGMAEKVTSGRDGLTFKAGDSANLAEALLQAKDPPLWTALRGGIVPPAEAESIAEQHIALYLKHLQRKNSEAVAV